MNLYCNLQGGRCDRGGYRATLGPVKPHSVNIALCVSQQPEREKFYFSNWVNSFSLPEWKEGSFEDTRFVCDKN